MSISKNINGTLAAVEAARIITTSVLGTPEIKLDDNYSTVQDIKTQDSQKQVSSDARTNNEERDRSSEVRDK